MTEQTSHNAQDIDNARSEAQYPAGHCAHCACQLITLVSNLLNCWGFYALESHTSASFHSNGLRTWMVYASLATEGLLSPTSEQSGPSHKWTAALDFTPTPQLSGSWPTFNDKPTVYGQCMRLDLTPKTSECQENQIWTSTHPSTWYKRRVNLKSFIDSAAMSCTQLQ